MRLNANCLSSQNHFILASICLIWKTGPKTLSSDGYQPSAVAKIEGTHSWCSWSGVLAQKAPWSEEEPRGFFLALTTIRLFIQASNKSEYHSHGRFHPPSIWQPTIAPPTTPAGIDQIQFSFLANVPPNAPPRTPPASVPSIQEFAS